MPSIHTTVWLHGIVAAFIGGGAGAVSAALSAMIVAPDTFNVNGGLISTLQLMTTTFLVNGAISVFAYLKQSPVPPDWDGLERRDEIEKQAVKEEAAKKL